MKNIIIILLLFASIMLGGAEIEDFFFSVSENVGFAFLKTMPDAFSSSIAEGGAAGYNSPSAYLVNPASAPYSMTRGLAFSYINSFGLLNRGFFNISFPVKIGYMFGGIGFSVSDTVQLRGENPTEEPLGSFNFSSVTASAGYGLYINNGIYWGASVRGIAEYSYLISKISAVFNTGFIMTFEQIDGLSAGLSFLNIGPNYRYDLYSNDFIVTPFTLRAGLSYRRPLGEDLILMGYADYVKPNDSQYNASIAGTVTYRDMLSLSGGYVFNDNTRSYSLGMGISVDRFDIRYTLKPYSSYLGFENILTVMMDF